MSEPTYWYSGVVWSLLRAIDKGVVVDMDETHRHIEAGDLFDWLASELGSDWADWTAHDDEVRRQVMTEFQAYSEIVDERRKFGVERNGLCLLVAYAVDKLQQRD